MARTAHAAQQFRDEVLAARPRAKVEVVDEVDGLGVRRTLRLSKAATKWVEPLLPVLDDRRIAGFGYDDDGLLEVTFSPLARLGDVRTPYDLAGARAVLDEKPKSKPSEDADKGDGEGDPAE